MKKIFARFGVPDEVVSDDGSQYSNTRNLFSTTHEFKQFAEEWGFRHTTSSPEHPQSNGAAERAVQTAKRIFKAAVDKKDPFEGLLKYRNTPFEDIGVSPVQLLMSRRTRTVIPTHRRLLLPQAVDPDQVVKALKSECAQKSKIFKISRQQPKLNSAHILRLGRPKCKTNHEILRLAEYRFIYKKIDNNRIPSKCRFWSSKFKTKLEASRHKIKQPRPIKTIKS